MTLLSLCIPPRHGEPDATYYASVLAKLPCASWYDHRYGQVGTAGYVPTVWWLKATEPNFIQGLEAAATNPNNMYLLGNEPCLNGVTPEEAARAVRAWETRLSAWAVDYAAPGVNISVHRMWTALTWLDAYLFEGGPVPPTWSVHIYGDAEAFENALTRFETWMDGMNVRRPVIVSEFGTDGDPAALMAVAENMIRSGRLRDAYWFSAYYAPWNETGLLDADGELTEIGEAWMRQAHEVSLPLVMRAA